MLAIGGLELKDQRKVLLVKRPRVIVATLGRLLEMLAKEYVSLAHLKVLALDEADKFTVKGKAKAWQDLESLIDQLRPEARVVAFSATYTAHQLNSFTTKLEQRAPISRLFVEEHSIIGKVPENIKVRNVRLECKGNLSDQLKAKLTALETLTAGFKDDNLEDQSY